MKRLLILFALTLALSACKKDRPCELWQFHYFDTYTGLWQYNDEIHRENVCDPQELLNAHNNLPTQYGVDHGFPIYRVYIKRL